MKTMYDFKATKPDGSEISLSEFSGKVILVVNTASKCGFTPQYDGLEKIYEKYAEKGLVILGFPCNQFGGQEPGTNSDIQEFCKLNYGVTFPVFSKVDVNGENEDPLFTWLKKEKPGFMGSQKIKWNFTKFLIDRNGKPVKRFPSTVKPEKMEKDIVRLLDKE